jgi:hypothetical protein
LDDTQTNFISVYCILDYVSRAIAAYFRTIEVGKDVEEERWLKRSKL